MALGARARNPALALQRRVARVAGWVLIPATAGLLRFGLGYRIAGMKALRRRYRELRADRDGPLLICANHLTMIDSALVAWALGSPWFYLRNFSALPWNVPERSLFAATWWSRALTYAAKCVPIERGGRRREVSETMARFARALAGGDAGLVFPEGGRSRSGRVEVDSAAYGVGRLLRALPRCRVLCIYLRGETQSSFSDLPARGERFHVGLAQIDPKTDQPGLRGSRELSRQILRSLVELEREHFDARQ